MSGIHELADFRCWISVEGNSAEVKLAGMCAGCPSAYMTLYLGVEAALRDEIPEFEAVRLV